MTSIEIYQAGYAIPTLPERWFMFNGKRFKIDDSRDLSAMNSIEIDTGYGTFRAYPITQLRASSNGR